MALRRPCTERKSLEQAVIEIIAVVHNAEAMADANPDDLDQRLAYADSLAIQREAVKRLGAHSKEHGCWD